MTATQAGAKIADTMLASIEQMPASVRYAAVEGLIARLTELVPFDPETQRKAEQIGVPAEELVRQNRERDEEERIRTRVGPALVLACDQLGEEIAAIAASAGGGGNGGDDASVVDALLTLWKLRWDIGLFAGERRENDVEQSEQAEGGAP